MPVRAVLPTHRAHAEERVIERVIKVVWDSLKTTIRERGQEIWRQESARSSRE